MSGCPSADCGGDFGRYDYAIGVIFIIGVIAVGTAGAVLGYAAGYGLAVLAVLAVAAILLCIVLGHVVFYWVVPAGMFVAVSFLLAADVVLSFPVAGTAPWGSGIC